MSTLFSHKAELSFVKSKTKISILLFQKLSGHGAELKKCGENLSET